MHPKTKINFVIGYLEGDAQKWLNPYLVEEGTNPGSIHLLNNWQAFWEQLNSRFGEHNKVEKYRIALSKLKQTKDVQSFLYEFQRLCYPLGYNENTQRDMFYDGLNSEVHRYMMNGRFKPRDHTRDEVFQEALRIWEDIETFKTLHPTSGGGTSQTQTQKSTTASTSTATTVTRTRFNTGDNVYRMKDGRAQKGKIESIGRHNNTTSPVVKWNNADKAERVTFNELKKDERPIVAYTAPKPAPANPKGPGPMELDGKGFNKAQCYTCKGYGHLARACPSKPLSGNEAELIDFNSDEESGKGSDQAL
ncbi:hypothetical protein RSAG8_04282, partial [Rhizoctonia solani AG-8 WAC10335]